MKFNLVFNLLKKQLEKLVNKHKDVVIPKIEEYITEKTPECKDKLIAFILNNVDLPFPIKLFKKTIKKTLSKNIDKFVEFILLKIKNI